MSHTFSYIVNTNEEENADGVCTVDFYWTSFPVIDNSLDFEHPNVDGNGGFRLQITGEYCPIRDWMKKQIDTHFFQKFFCEYGAVAENRVRSSQEMTGGRALKKFLV